MTANSFTSVSLEPLLILVCVAQEAQMLGILQKQKCFGINILKAGQQAISEFFAQAEQPEDAEKALGIRYRWTPSGVPLLEDTLVQLACDVVFTHAAGDHTVFLGEVNFAEIFSGEPLLFFRGKYRQVSPSG
jgi:flavin reductase (DIM6/NTAB) family NADH-FMN oxidoreductase RutF